MANEIAYANLDTLSIATGPRYVRGKIEDTFFDMHPWYERVRANKDGIQDYKGTGKVLLLPIRIGSNGTIINMSTRSTYSIAEQETMTNLVWPWGSIGGSMAFFDEDLHDNMDKQQLVDVLQPAMDQTIDTTVDRLSRNILAENSGTGGFQFLGLQDAVNDGTHVHPTAGYGGISDFTTYPGWKSFLKDNAGVLANLVNDMDNTFNTVTFGTKQRQPDLVLTTQKGEELYRASQNPNIRYLDTKQGDAEIDDVVFRGRPVVFDRQVQSIDSTTGTPTGWSGTLDTASTNRFYFLNSRYWQFYFDQKWNLDSMIEKDWRIPVNSQSRVKLVTIRGQFVCTQRRYQGLLFNVPNS